MVDLDAQRALGRTLVGKFVRFHHERKTHPGYLVIDVDEDGMIELREFSGLFAPDLVERVDHPHTAAEGNS
jgi:hypothetical protein